MTPDALVIIISTQLLKKTLWPTFDNKFGTTPVIKESSVSEWSSRTTSDSCACYMLTVSVLLFFVSRSPKEPKRSSGLQVICYIIVYFLPDPFPVLVSHTRTQLLSQMLRYSLALAFPIPSSLSHAEKWYCTFYWNARGSFSLFLSLSLHKDVFSQS